MLLNVIFKYSTNFLISIIKVSMKKISNEMMMDHCTQIHSITNLFKVDEIKPINTQHAARAEFHNNLHTQNSSDTLSQTNEIVKLMVNAINILMYVTFCVTCLSKHLSNNPSKLTLPQNSLKCFKTSILELVSLNTYLLNVEIH